MLKACNKISKKDTIKFYTSFENLGKMVILENNKNENFKCQKS